MSKWQILMGSVWGIDIGFIPERWVDITAAEAAAYCGHILIRLV
jgi:hypothetical protein